MFFRIILESNLCKMFFEKRKDNDKKMKSLQEIFWMAKKYDLCFNIHFLSREKEHFFLHSFQSKRGVS